MQPSQLAHHGHPAPATLADLAALDAALARDHAAHQRAERAPDASFAQAIAAVGEALL